MANSSLFSNHGNVLLVLSDDPESRLRDVAAKVGITERAVQKIVRDLQDEGIVSVQKHGRRNRYRINTRKALHHPLSANRTVGHLLNLMRDGPARTAVPEAKDPVPAEPEVRAEADATVPESPRAPKNEPPVRDGSKAPDEVSPAVPPERDSGEEPAPDSDSDSGRKKKRPRADPDEQQGSLF